MCYVGKATKIFFFVVAVLAAVGLVLGLGVLRLRQHHGGAPRPCDGPGCRPGLPEPIPATADASSPPPLLSPPTPASPVLGPSRT